MAVCNSKTLSDKTAQDAKCYELNFFESVTPTKLTLSRMVKLRSRTWGLLSDYYLESVKINNNCGNIESTATLRVCDRSGEVTCVVKGSAVSRLFGLTNKEWIEIENLSKRDGQLFYRYFKYGLNKSFSEEQKMFYYFCMDNQKQDVLVAVYTRLINTRNKNKQDTLIRIVQLEKANSTVLDLYNSYLRKLINL